MRRSIRLLPLFLACTLAMRAEFKVVARYKVDGDTSSYNYDSDTGRVIATPVAGENPDGLVFDPSSGNVFTSNPGGTITVIHEDTPDKYSTVANVATSTGAKRIALDGKNGRVVTCAPQFGPRPPAPKDGAARPKAPMLAGTFEVILVGEK